MRKIFSILLLALATGSATAGTSNLDGWSILVEGGVHFYQDGETKDYPFPLATVPALTDRITVAPVAGPAGNSAIQIYNFQNPSDPFEFSDPQGGLWAIAQQRYTLGISQTVHLTAGGILSGWAQFGSWDGAEFLDYAQITINGSEIWRYGLDQFPGAEIGDHSLSPWEHWSFTAPSDGAYTIQFRVYGDDQEESYALFQLDSLVQVPEPGSLGLLAAGFGLLLLRKRFRA